MISKLFEFSSVLYETSENGKEDNRAEEDSDDGLDATGDSIFAYAREKKEKERLKLESILSFMF